VTRGRQEGSSQESEVRSPNLQEKTRRPGEQVVNPKSKIANPKSRWLSRSFSAMLRADQDGKIP
jgi:hypothetical protein